MPTRHETFFSIQNSSAGGLQTKSMVILPKYLQQNQEKHKNETPATNEGEKHSLIIHSPPKKDGESCLPKTYQLFGVRGVPFRKIYTDSTDFRRKRKIIDFSNVLKGKESVM